MVNWKALGYLIYTKFREYGREPEFIFWALVFPVLLSAGLGIAFRERAPDKSFTAVVRSEAADKIAGVLNASGFVQAEVLDENEALQALRRGKVSLIVRAGKELGYQFDPTRPESQLARNIVNDVLQRAAGRTDPVPATDAAFRETGARYIDFLIPGLIGMNLMSGGLWGVGFAIAEMKAKKLIKRLIATPMGRFDFLLSVLAVRLIIMVLEMAILLVFGALAFGMKIRAPILEVVFIGILGALTFGAMGLWLAARVERLESVTARINVLMMPMFVLSGVFFSWERFPPTIRPFIRALPLTAVNDALRAAVNEGVGLSGLAAPLGILAAWGLISFSIAFKRFRWL